jgi:hypothetical protein
MNQDSDCVPLEWEPGKTVEFDSTMMFGIGYDFEGMEHLAEEADTSLGRFVIWPDCLGGSKNWSLYGGDAGYFQSGFPTKEAAKAEVLRMHVRSISC